MLLTKVLFISPTWSHGQLPLSRQSKLSPCRPVSPAIFRIPRACIGSPTAPASSGRSGADDRPLRPPGAGPSAEFLNVSGTIATCGGVLLVALLCLTPIPTLLLQSRNARISLTACATFFYTLSMCQFDLRAARRLILTISLALLTRAILIPLLSLSFATIALLIPHPSIAIPKASLSTLGLVAAIPPSFSPPLASLAAHVYPTLSALLTVTSLALAPFLALFSVSVCTAVCRVITPLAPALGAPFCPVPLFLSTTAPAVIALALHRATPRRIAAPVTFAALPIAWVISALLIASAARAALAEPIALGFGSCVLVSSAVVIASAVGARMLTKLLALELRVSRTIMLYFCVQGVVIAAAIAPEVFATAPAAAAAVVGIIVTAVLTKAWNKVIVRTGSES